MTCKFKNELKLKFLDSNTEEVHDAFITTRYYPSKCTYIMIYIYSNTEDRTSLINQLNDNSAVDYNTKSYKRYEYRVECQKPSKNNLEKKSIWKMFKSQDKSQDKSPDYLTQFYDEYVNNKEFKNNFSNGIIKGNFFCGNLEEVRNNFITTPNGGYSKNSKKKYNKRIYGIHKKSKHRKRLQTRKNKGQRYK